MGFLLASSGWMPGMLLNVLQCTGRPPTRNYLVQNVNIASVDKPDNT